MAENGRNGILNTIVLTVFRGVITILLGIMAWFGNLVYQKIDVSVDKAELARTTARLWESIGTATKAQNELVTNLQVLGTQFKAHENADEVVNHSVADHESRIRVLEVARPKP